MTPHEDETRRSVVDPADDPWAWPEALPGSWLSEQVRLIAIEEGFTD